MPSYCTVAECERETRQGRARCELHEKRHQRKKDLHAPVAEKLTPEERLFEAFRRAEDSSAEDDREYASNRRKALQAVKAFTRKTMSDTIRQALANARKNGVRLGRPPTLLPQDVEALVALWGGIRPAARELGVARSTIQRAMRRGGSANRDSATTGDQARPQTERG